MASRRPASDAPDDARAQERIRRTKQVPLFAPLTAEECAPLPRHVVPAEHAAEMRDACERDRRVARAARMEELGVTPPDWTDAADVARAEREAREAGQERERRAVQREGDCDDGRVIGMRGSWLYGRFMTPAEVAEEFERREGRPMGSPLTPEARAALHRRPHATRSRRGRGD